MSLASVVEAQIQDWDSLAKHVREGQMKAQERAWAKLGKKPLFKSKNERKATAKPKPAEIKKEKEREAKQEAGVSRSTGVENTQGFACPVCWGVPKNLRTDCYSVARHLPVNPEAKRYRDTEFCDGQGKIAVMVITAPWKQGTEPRQKMSAKKWRMGKQGKGDKL